MTNTSARTIAKKFNKADSARNCVMSCRRWEPIALRTPTSLARLIARGRCQVNIIHPCYYNNEKCNTQ